MKYLFFLFPFICLGQIRSDQSGHVLDSTNVGIAVGGTSIANIRKGIDFTMPPTGPTPGAARTAIPDFTGLTIVDVAAVEGWDAADMSQEIQAQIALYDGVGTPTVLLLDGDNGAVWPIGNPIDTDGVQDLYVWVEDGVTLQMNNNAWNAGTPDDLLSFNNSDNLKIYAYGATFAMDKDAFTSSEQAHVFEATGSDGVELWGGIYKSSGGDGSRMEDMTNFQFRDVVFDDNSRQGISPITVTNGTIDGCVFSNTSPNGVGAATAGPWDGVDFEPNNNTQGFVNITVSNSDMLDNDNAFMELAIGDLDGTSTDLSITVTDCYGSGNMINPWTTSVGEMRINCAPSLGGTVDFTRVFIDGSNEPGIYQLTDGDGFLTTYEDIVLFDTNKTRGHASIRMRRIGTPCAAITTLGSIFFDNVTVFNKVDDYIFDVATLGSSETFKNVTGNIKGITSFTAKDIVYDAAYNTANNSNVTLSFDMDASPPSTTLSIAAINDVAAEDTQNNLLFRVTRTSSEVDYALPFRVTYSGTSTIRDDYHGLPSGFVIPAGASTFDITVIPRNDEWTNAATEGNETVIITIQPMTDAYTIGTASATGTIKETL